MAVRKKKTKKKAKKREYIPPAQKLAEEKALVGQWTEYLEKMRLEAAVNDKTNKPVGRPSKYNPVFCELLIEHGKTGMSFEAFAGQIGVVKSTLYEWVKEHPEFSDAKKVAEDYCRYTWEKIGIMGARGLLPGFSAASFVFNMKNRYGWKDKQDITSGDKPIAPPAQVIIELPSNGREIDDDEDVQL
jgi:hypothetical protein